MCRIKHKKKKKVLFGILSIYPATFNFAHFLSRLESIYSHETSTFLPIKISARVAHICDEQKKEEERETLL